jgi:hypothetical protein
MTDDALVAAEGTGAELFDDRAIFFLQHREQIERWGGLRWDACQAVSRYLESLGDRVAELSQQWAYWSGAIGKYQCHALTPTPVETESTPGIAVGLGWYAAAVMPEKKGDNTSPFVGIYIDPDHDQAEVLRNALDTADVGLAHGYASSKPWPRYQLVIAPSGWWRNLDDYSEKLLEGVSGLLAKYEEPLSRALAIQNA